jgi:hypothetical protein
MLDKLKVKCKKCSVVLNRGEMITHSNKCGVEPKPEKKSSKQQEMITITLAPVVK